MLELERTLAIRLAEMKVRIEVPDTNTVLFRNVPANRRFYNKPRANVLLKRPTEGMPFLVCVDEDLEYRGPDACLTRAFIAGVKREGWRALCLEHSLHTDLQEAAAGALAALGFDGQEPGLAPPNRPETLGKPGRLLGNLGSNLSQVVRDSNTEPTVAREDAVDEAASCVLRWGQTRLAVIVGESGVGKTNLLHAIARRLSQCRPGFQLVSLDLGVALAGTLFDAERENLLSAVLKEAASSSDTVLALEHLELALSIPRGPALLAQSADNGVRILGTTLPRYLSGFECPPLARRISIVELPELSGSETVAVLQALAGQIARHHGIEIDESCIRGCVQAVHAVPGHLPAKAIAVLDAAAAKAALSGAAVIGPDDIYFAASRHSERPEEGQNALER